jgi:hypothetical protein
MLWRSLWGRWVEACFLKVLGSGQKISKRKVFHKIVLEPRLREKFGANGLIKKQIYPFATHGHEWLEFNSRSSKDEA